MFEGVLAILVTVAVGLLINRYTGLMGFRLTATAVGVILAVVVIQAARHDLMVELLGVTLGPFMNRHPVLFLLIWSLAGAIIFAIAGVLFMKNYDRLEKAMAGPGVESAKQVPVPVSPAAPPPVAPAPASKSDAPAPAPTAGSAAPGISRVPPASNQPTQQPQEGPVDWDFSKPKAEIDTIFGFNVHSLTEKLLVSVITLSGRNRTDEPLTNVRAHVIPQNTGARLRLKFNVGHQHGELAEPDQTYGIPPHSTFKMQYYIPTSDPTNIHKQGIPFSEYLTKYGALRFVFEHGENKSYSYDIPFARVKAIFEERQRQRDEALKEGQPPPRVQKRSD